MTCVSVDTVEKIFEVSLKIGVALIVTLIVTGLLCIYRFQCSFDGVLMLIYGTVFAFTALILLLGLGLCIYLSEMYDQRDLTSNV
jgi:hypothetical protein